MSLGDERCLMLAQIEREREAMQLRLANGETVELSVDDYHAAKLTAFEAGYRAASAHGWRTLRL